MARHKNPPTPQTLSAVMRDAAESIRRRMAEAPPGAQGELAAKLAKLTQDIAAQEMRETAAAETSPEQLLEARLRYEDEIERKIEERAMERALFMLNPPDWEMDNRARQIAQKEGGQWWDHLPRVHEEQGAFVARLLKPVVEDTDIRRWVRE